MGNNHSFNEMYSVPISQPKQNESAVYRNPNVQDKLIELPQKGYRTVVEGLKMVVKDKPNKEVLGTINPITKQYEWITYSQFYQNCKNLGSGIENLNLAPYQNDFLDFKLKLIAIYSKNREEWITTDLGGALYNVTTVALYDTLGSESIHFILNQTQIETIFCSLECLKKFLQEKVKVEKIKNLVCFDQNVDQSTLNEVIKQGYKFFYYSDVLKAGEKNQVVEAKITPDDVYAFSYTSGTTGHPKGVMLTNRNIVAMFATVEYHTGGLIQYGRETHLSYLPLAHIFEKVVLTFMILNACESGFYNGDTLKIKEDLVLLKPTFFPSVPRLFNKFYDIMTQGMGKLVGLKKKLADQAVKTKKHNLYQNSSYKHFFYDSLIFSKIKKVFGGRVKCMLTGSAPISGEVLDFMRIAVCCPLLEAYGQTESTGGSFITNLHDPTTGHVGGPTVCTEFKVIDVPEMKYLSTDKDKNGITCPRGEICMRGSSIFVGYYKEIDKTQEAIDNEGWLHTGDIGIINPNGSLSIIDRKKNIFKLAFGEYVAPEKIEILYKNSHMIEEIYVHGDSLQTYLIAVIFPHEPSVKQIAQKLGITNNNFKELINNEQIKQEYLDHLTKYGKENKLVSYEIPKKIIFIDQSFAAHDLITTTFKIKRFETREYYKNDFNRLYNEKQVNQINQWICQLFYYQSQIFLNNNVPLYILNVEEIQNVVQNINVLQKLIKKPVCVQKIYRFLVLKTLLAVFIQNVCKEIVKIISKFVKSKLKNVINILTVVIRWSALITNVNFRLETNYKVKLVNMMKIVYTGIIFVIKVYVNPVKIQLLKNIVLKKIIYVEIINNAGMDQYANMIFICKIIFVKKIYVKTVLKCKDQFPMIYFLDLIILNKISQQKKKYRIKILNYYFNFISKLIFNSSSFLIFFYYQFNNSNQLYFSNIHQLKLDAIYFCSFSA